MKAVVLEIRDGEAAALREDGIVIRTKQKCSVGDIIEVRAEIRSVRKGLVRAVSAAAASLVLLGGIGGVYTYQNVMACSYVSIDINPSIEWILNRKNLTIGVSALGEDGENLVKEIRKSDVKKLTLEEALDLTCDVLEDSGYVTDEGESYMLVNVTGPTEEKIEELRTAAEGILEKRESNLNLAVTEASPDERSQAIDLGISPGVYQEISAIEKSDNPDAEINRDTVEKYSGRTVRDYMEKAGILPEKKNEDMSSDIKNESTAPERDNPSELSNKQDNPPEENPAPSGNKENSANEGEPDSPGIKTADSGQSPSEKENDPKENEAAASGKSERENAAASDEMNGQGAQPRGDAMDAMGSGQGEAPGGAERGGGAQGSGKGEVPGGQGPGGGGRR